MRRIGTCEALNRHMRRIAYIDNRSGLRTTIGTNRREPGVLEIAGVALGVERLWRRHLPRPAVSNYHVMLANSFHEIGQFAFVAARIRHQIGHLTRQFLSSEVGVLKFRAADMCAKNGEKHRNKGFVHVF